MCVSSIKARAPEWCAHAVPSAPASLSLGCCFWQTCTAALVWLDDTYPSCAIGLYGEPTKAAPLYLDLGFNDVGKTRFWRGSYNADAILSADTASARGTNGKRAVNSRVRAITVGQSTALTVGKGSVLLPGVLASDEGVLGSSRTQALQRYVCLYVCLVSIPPFSLSAFVCQYSQKGNK